jgi:hypothetical protein
VSPVTPCSIRRSSRDADTRRTNPGDFQIVISHKRDVGDAPALEEPSGGFSAIDQGGSRNDLCPTLADFLICLLDRASRRYNVIDQEHASLGREGRTLDQLVRSATLPFLADDEPFFVIENRDGMRELVRSHRQASHRVEGCFYALDGVEDGAANDRKVATMRKRSFSVDEVVAQLSGRERLRLNRVTEPSTDNLNDLFVKAQALQWEKAQDRVFGLGGIQAGSGFVTERGQIIPDAPVGSRTATLPN